MIFFTIITIVSFYNCFITTIILDQQIRPFIISCTSAPSLSKKSNIAAKSNANLPFYNLTYKTSYYIYFIIENLTYFSAAKSHIFPGINRRFFSINHKQRQEQKRRQRTDTRHNLEKSSSPFLGFSHLSDGSILRKRKNKRKF